MAKVALIYCENYDDHKVKEAVRRGLGLIGGTKKFAASGQQVLLKPNLLLGDLPENCVNTHHAVFRAVAESFKETGARLSYGDSPAVGSMASAARKCGIQAVAKELDIAEADFKTAVEVFYDKGIQNKIFFIAKAITENNVVISLPKLKTHAFEKITGSVKNQFGCIPGVRKGEYHIKLPNANHFAQMLVDLNNLVKPALYVMDGISAMEGNGPRGGKPKQMNILLFSDDPIALDATVCRLIDLKPEYVPTITLGQASGTGSYLENDIELVGDDFKIFKQNNFAIDRSPLQPYETKGFTSFMSNLFVPKPFIIREKCIACGVCIKMCPMTPKSVDWPADDKTGPPIHNYKTCIRCFCCQELCPESAIELKFPLARKIFGGKM